MEPFIMFIGVGAHVFRGQGKKKRKKKVPNRNTENEVSRTC